MIPETQQEVTDIKKISTSLDEAAMDCNNGGIRCPDLFNNFTKPVEFRIPSFASHTNT